MNLITPTNSCLSRDDRSFSIKERDEMVVCCEEKEEEAKHRIVVSVKDYLEHRLNNINLFIMQFFIVHEQEKRTFFVAVQIMDLCFVEGEGLRLEFEKIGNLVTGYLTKIIALGALLLASKYEEVCPFSAKDLAKFSRVPWKHIVLAERAIFNKLFCEGQYTKVCTYCTVDKLNGYKMTKLRKDMATLLLAMDVAINWGYLKGNENNYFNGLRFWTESVLRNQQCFKRGTWTSIQSYFKNHTQYGLRFVFEFGGEEAQNKLKRFLS